MVHPRKSADLVSHTETAVSTFDKSLTMSSDSCGPVKARSNTLKAEQPYNLPGAVPSNPNSGRRNSQKGLGAFKGDIDSVKVVVRLRPINERERASRNALTYRVLNRNQVVIEDNRPMASVKEKTQSFTYDLAYEEDTSQQEVFETSVKHMIDQMLQGYNGCIFCYGQTGSGKTYTMTGTDQNPGLIFRTAAHIQQFVDAQKGKMNISVEVSYLEIYQEMLRDLLSDNPKNNGALQIREDEKLGVFVQGLNERSISRVEDYHSALREGLKRRVTAATNMNDESSRSHAVFTIHIKQLSPNDQDGSSLIESRIHLVDLAGSERVESTGATGARLKEGALINQSLSALGNVMKGLVNNTPHIPYRDSKLTRILQDSLGGNSMTLMVANISPAQSALGETTSTLRFADRAKQIKNQPIINIDPKMQRIRELEQQVEKYKKALSRCCSCSNSGMELKCTSCHSQVDIKTLHPAEDTGVRSRSARRMIKPKSPPEDGGGCCSSGRCSIM